MASTELGQESASAWATNIRRAIKAKFDGVAYGLGDGLT